MGFLVFALIAVACIWFAIVLHTILRKKESILESLGVSDVYPRSPLPGAKIDAYLELKEKLRGQYAKDGDSEMRWMSALPAQAKDVLKYRLMQRAIGDMAALQKIDADARGYWRLFSKGMITHTFWKSVVEAERDLSAELESVKREAACVEPTQDPQGIISEAMQFIMRYGHQLPSAADVAGTDAFAELLGRLPAPPGTPSQGGAAAVPGIGPLGLGPAGPLGLGLPGAARPPSGPGQGPPLGAPMHGPNAVPQAGGETEAFTWKQDGDEVEVSVIVPGSATKADVKVAIAAKKLRVEHAGTALVDGQLAAACLPEGSTWTLSKGRVVVSLEKADPRPWPSLLKI